jgi:hypothetical protein
MIHYSWGLDIANFTPDNRHKWIDYAKWSKAMSMPMTWGVEATAEDFNYAVDICKHADAGLCLNYSPWHRSYPFDYAPANLNTPDAIKELDTFTAVLKKWRTWITQANEYYRCLVPVKAILLDCEKFDAGKDDRLNLKLALDKITALTKAVYPKAKIYWYNHATWIRSTELTEYWTGEEITQAICPAFYWPRHFEWYEEHFANNILFAQQKGIAEIVAYISLGAGYDGASVWHDDLDYPVDISRQIGAFVKSHPEIKAVVFYPQPFCPSTPQWEAHFEAYKEGMK